MEKNIISLVFVVAGVVLLFSLFSSFEEEAFEKSKLTSFLQVSKELNSYCGYPLQTFSQTITFQKYNSVNYFYNQSDGIFCMDELLDENIECKRMECDFSFNYTSQILDDEKVLEVFCIFNKTSNMDISLECRDRYRR